MEEIVETVIEDVPEDPMPWGNRNAPYLYSEQYQARCRDAYRAAQARRCRTLLRVVVLTALVAAAAFGWTTLANPSTAHADEVSPDGKGIIGGALLGAEVVTIPMSLFQIRSGAVYAIGGGLGAVGGELNGIGGLPELLRGVRPRHGGCAGQHR